MDSRGGRDAKGTCFIVCIDPFLLTTYFKFHSFSYHILYLVVINCSAFIFSFNFGFGDFIFSFQNAMVSIFVLYASDVRVASSQFHKFGYPCGFHLVPIVRDFIGEIYNHGPFNFYFLFFLTVGGNAEIFKRQ
jgi:hypothetical protein